jgi:hypothetical protein
MILPPEGGCNIAVVFDIELREIHINTIRVD